MTSLASLSTIARGVLEGTRKPFQAEIAKSGYVSLTVGTSGNCFIRLSEATPMIRALPLSTCGMISAALPKYISTWPPRRAVIAGAPPRNGMCTASSPARAHEQRTGQMGDRAYPARGIIDLAHLGIGDELGDAPGRNRGADRKNERSGAEDADRSEVLSRIIIDLLHVRHDRDLRSGGEEQRVAIGRACAT